VPGEVVLGDVCSFTVDHEQSNRNTVQEVEWTTDFANVTRARIEFGLAGGELGMTAPVDLEELDEPTYLVGMKADRDYAFRIVAESEAGTCTSSELSFTTGSLPDGLPLITKAVSKPGASQGFIVTTPGVDPDFAGQARDLPSAYIFDTDGDLVWWIDEVVFDAVHAQLSWDAKHVWFFSRNSAQPDFWNVVEAPWHGIFFYPEGVGFAPYDFAVFPNDGVAAPHPEVSTDPPSYVELRSTEFGRGYFVLSDLSELYDAEEGGFRPTAVRYQPEDDTVTFGDSLLGGFIKVTHAGDLVWQLGGSSPKGDSFALEGIEQWADNNGYHLTSDGRLLFFNNTSVGAGGDPASRVVELQLDEENWTATKTWEYQDDAMYSADLGDVQRLPNGNVLITYSMLGVMREVTPSGEIVQEFDNSHSFATRAGRGWALFGYAEFRTSLYGPPLR